MDEQDVRVRRYGEVVLNTLSSVKTVLEYPKGTRSHDPCKCSIQILIVNRIFQT